MNEEWLRPGVAIIVDHKTVAALLAEVKRLREKTVWVGLTDQELDLLWLDYHGSESLTDGRILDYELAIEAAFKEKNGG